MQSRVPLGPGKFHVVVLVGYDILYLQHVETKEITFSNSLIIHQVKTKKITTVKEVWIPGLNDGAY